MLDQSLVQSGFDAEILLGEGQLSYALIALIDAGHIPTQVAFGDTLVTLRGPAQIDRTYEPNPDAPFPAESDTRHPFEVEILFDHETHADLRIHLVVEAATVGIEADLFVALSLATVADETGMLGSASLHVELLDLDSPALAFIESTFHIDKATILAGMKAQVDRDLDLGSVGAFKRLQSVALRKLEATEGHPRAYGLYVNLRLQDGPEPMSLKADRGSTGDAVNLLPEGSDLAMVTRPGLFADMATDAFQRLAEIDEEGHVSHPWHRSIRNPKSEVIGKIKGVSVSPKPDPNPHSGGGFLNTLRIDVHVEYDSIIDPDLHMTIDLTPGTDDQGAMVWRIDADFHASVLLEVIGFLVLASIFTGIGGLVGLGLGAAIAAGLVTGSLADALGHFIVDDIFSGRVEAKVDAGMPDVVSGRVEVGQRRWDPLYTTHHDIAMRPDGAVVNHDGVALWGRAVIDRRVVPVDHVVIRDKLAQSPRPPTHLRYRVDDADLFRADFTAIAPGTDRRDITQHDPLGEPTLFQLSIEQITSRLAERRIVPDLAYIAKRVDIRQNQAHSILVISNRELNEQRNALIGAFEEATRPVIEAEQGEQIRADVIAAFEAEGESPTEEEIVAQVQARIDAILDEETDAFTQGRLGTQLELALQPLLRFDLAPEYFAELQRLKILHLLDLEVITMRSGFRYYRDHPDFHKPDNLLSLPRYKETPQGPVLPGG